MSIRVATVSFTQNPWLMGAGEPGGGSLNLTSQNPIGLPAYWPFDFDSYFGGLEASPIYTELSTRLRISGGDDDGFDETFTVTRTPIIHDYSFAGPIVFNQGLNGVDFGNGAGDYSGGGAIFFVGRESAAGSYAGFGVSQAGYTDPKKQRINVWPSYVEFITRGGYGDIIIYAPSWDDTITGERVFPRFWGFGTNPGEYVDTSAWSATKWRDYRGTYTATVTSGYLAFGGTATYDWTLS